MVRFLNKKMVLFPKYFIFCDCSVACWRVPMHREGREFESRHPDLIAKQPHMAAFFQWHILFISYKVASMEDFILALLIILRDGLLNTIQETQNQPGLTDPGE